MDIKAEKIELAKMLLETDDQVLIEEIKALFKSHHKDFWVDLPEHVKKGTIEALQQIENGNFTTLEEVKKIVAAR